MAGKFKLFEDKAGEYRFRLKATNGEIILASEGYKRKYSALNVVKSVTKNAAMDNRFERKDTTSGKQMFDPKASNGQLHLLRCLTFGLEHLGQRDQSSNTLCTRDCKVEAVWVLSAQKRTSLSFPTASIR